MGNGPLTSQPDEPSPVLYSLLGVPLYPLPAGTEREKQIALLAEAQRLCGAGPQTAGKMIWVGRRLGYLWEMNDAIKVFTDALEQWPDSPALYRHRGHRYISIREFALAEADLLKAAELSAGRADEIEEDGQPNDKNVPLTTLRFNIEYHLGLARYLQGNFAEAEQTYRHLGDWIQIHRKALVHRAAQGEKQDPRLIEAARYDDNLVAVLDWHYMTLRRLGRSADAEVLLTAVEPEMAVIENAAYHRRLLMYKGLIRPEELLDLENAKDIDIATYGYGVGNWHLYNNRIEEARRIFEHVVQGQAWPAFGFIAAEVELVNLAAGAQ